MIFKRYVYRIYPNEEQKNIFENHFGACRWIYNKALEAKQFFWTEFQENLDVFDISRILTSIKKQEETKWLCEINTQSLQSSLLNLRKAYDNHFENQKNIPNFKRKIGRQTYGIPQYFYINENEQTIKLPRAGIVSMRLSRKIKGVMKTANVIKTVTNKYFISISTQIDSEKKIPKPINSKKTIGIDLGIKDFITINNGEKISNPKYLKQSLKRLAILHGRASRKLKGSQNRKKANLKVALQYEKVTNQRNDFLQKLSTKLVCDNQTNTICVESLAIKNLVKNHNLAQAISDASWSKFVSMLEYKCDWYGKNLIKIGRFEASSKLCHKCNFKNKNLTLKDREWTCENCKTHHDRDVNAAKNIRLMGLKQSGAVCSDESVEMLSIDKSMKQKNKKLKSTTKG